MRPFLRRSSLVAMLALATALQAQYPKPLLPADAQRSDGPAAQRSAPQRTPVAGAVDHAGPRSTWATQVRGMAYRKHQFPGVEAIKQAKWDQKRAAKPQPEQPGGAKAVLPEVGTSFEANWSTQQTPPDNSIAISNGGLIVSVNNDGIVYADENGSILYAAFWSDFFNDPSLTAAIYDPKVLYDSGADRFFLVVLHGSTAATSKVLTCFSQSNDPGNGWWIYQLTGNPLNDNSWFDYPSIGVSNNEVYVTGNLFGSGGGPFNQAVIYQMQKNDGYNGQNLDWQYWSGIGGSPFTAATIAPASWGQAGNYGPGILLVSGSSGGANAIRLFDLTDDMSGSPQLNDYVVNVTPYSPAADAQMPNSSDQLDNGDCRMLGAFFLNNTVHCVFHGDVGSGWNGILYKRINISNLTVQQTSLGTPGTADLSYPAMASFASSTTDPSVMIAYLRSSTTVNPEVRVVNCDATLQWSSSTLVKNGETHVDFLSGNERWGDYTGMARRHNGNTPEVWLAGCYGANVSGVLNNAWKTWVAQVGGGSVGVGGAVPTSTSRLYPVPAIDRYTLEFMVTERSMHTIALYDAKGSLVKVLYQDTPKPGPNQLTFNRGELAPGRYLLSITTPTTVVAHEDLVVD